MHDMNMLMTERCSSPWVARMAWIGYLPDEVLNSVQRRQLTFKKLEEIKPNTLRHLTDCTQ